MQASAGAASGGPRESLGAPLCANGWRGPLKAKQLTTTLPFYLFFSLKKKETILKAGWGPIRGKETAPSTINQIFQHLRFVVYILFALFQSFLFCFLPFFAFLLFCGPPVLSLPSHNALRCSMSLSPALERHCTQQQPNQRTKIWSKKKIIQVFLLCFFFL